MLTSRSVVAIFIGLLLNFRFIQCTHIYMKSGELRCFYEGLKLGELLIGDIDTTVEKNGVFEEDPLLKVSITVDETFDDDQRVMNQQSSHSGDFAFTALESGEHRVCIKPLYTADTTARIRMSIGFEIENVKVLDSKQKDTVEALKTRVRQLISRLQTIRNQQDRIRENEAVFRDQSEAANSKISSWSVIQILVLIGVCWFQLNYLKNFFVKQKVI
ncbi:putative member of the p24 [Monosporozyma unispora]|nr:putative member of the p24 [Kazachstania unispora]